MVIFCGACSQVHKPMQMTGISESREKIIDLENTDEN